MKQKFYITTAIDYVNDVIHVGHVYQKVIADVLARYHRLIGQEVYFLTGTDEHGGKAEAAAEKSGESVTDFVDRISAADKKQLEALDISFDRFIRTTDADHIKQVTRFYQKVAENGDIYKAKFSGCYCRGCEEYKTKSDLVDGHCPYHPQQEIEKLSEENYFFAWSKYEGFLKKYLQDNPSFIQPESRRQEMLAFLEEGLADISISRQRDNVSWGIPVPGDSSQTIYVWFDALINYLTGAPEGFWPADLHLIGKDNTRWHALLWPAMLQSASYPLPKQVYAHGFLSLNGQKISKSQGNIIRPQELVNVFGVDGARYVLLSATSLPRDGNISWAKMRDKYNDDLAKGLGNLAARIAKLAQLKELDYQPKERTLSETASQEYCRALEALQINQALKLVWQRIRRLDQFLNQEAPWQIESPTKAQKVLSQAVKDLRTIALLLQPFLPETSEKIIRLFNGQVKAVSPFFPRIEKQ